MWTSAFYNHWDYWNLYHKVTFDGVNKLILVNQGITSLNVQTDIYSSWKEWLLLGDNTKYSQALRVVGGDPTIGVEKLDATYFLVNGWRIKPYPGSYDLTITGNLFVDGGGDIKVSADINPLFPNNISINLNTSLIVRRLETTVSGSNSTGSVIVEGIVTASLVDSQLQILVDLANTGSTQLSILESLQTTSSLHTTALDNLNSTASVQLISLNNLGLSSSLELASLDNLGLSSSLAISALSRLESTASVTLDGIEGLRVSGSLQNSVLEGLRVTGSQQLTILNSIQSSNTQQLSALSSLQDTGSTQLDILNELKLKVDEIWKIHGLDLTGSLTVTPTARTAASITQVLTYVSESNTATVTRT